MYQSEVILIFLAPKIQHLYGGGGEILECAITEWEVSFRERTALQ